MLSTHCILVSESDISVSQRSVATCLRNAGIFNDRFIVNSKRIVEIGQYLVKSMTHNVEKIIIPIIPANVNVNNSSPLSIAAE